MLYDVITFSDMCVDLIVAGDSFDAGFLGGWLRGLPLARCLEIATACGRSVAGQVGGLAGQPRWEEVVGVGTRERPQRMPTRRGRERIRTVIAMQTGFARKEGVGRQRTVNGLPERIERIHDLPTSVDRNQPGEDYHSRLAHFPCAMRPAAW